jgi:hypothetical protein
MPETPRKRSFLIIAGTILLLVVVFCAGLGGLGYYFFIHEIEEPITEADKALLVTAEALAEAVPLIHVEPGLGAFRRIRHPDGSREISYKYATPEDSAAPLYVECVVSLELSASEAQGAYTGMVAGMKLNLSWLGEEGPQPTDRNDLFHWGDESKCMILETNGKAIGNIIVARKGKRVFYLVIVGFPFERPEPLRALLEPFLKRLVAYN